MLRNTARGLLAGAAGTAALNITTYADMALRGRASSSATSKMVSTLANMLQLPLSSKGVGAEDSTAQNRESGLGALLGYVDGLGTGIVYSWLHSPGEEISLPLAGALVGLLAMAGSDVPLVMLKVSDPKTWGISGWLSDLIPHLIYGFVTVATYEALANLDEEES